MTGRYCAFLALLLLASCGNLGDRLDALNPLNLFGDDAPVEGSDTADTAGQVEIAQPDDGRIEIPRVMNVRLDYTSSGVIVRADGEAPSLGFHSADLSPLNFGQPDGNGAIWYAFRATPPAIAQPGGDAFLRTLSVANFIPNSRLRNVQSVTITGAENDVTIRLR